MAIFHWGGFGGGRVLPLDSNEKKKVFKKEHGVSERIEGVFATKCPCGR